jgi:hypothetical protein
MVKLSESKGKSGDGYTRIFGNESIGRLLSKTQSSVIRSGFELEEEICASIPENMWATLGELSEISYPQANIPEIQIVFKPTRPDPEKPDKSIQADFLVVDNKNRRFMLIEIKEGYVFDTKKADGELNSLKNITSWLAQEFAFRTQYYLCSFNQEDKTEIVNGSKKRFTMEHILTGREFCEIIGIDYEQLRERRKANQKDNRLYFLSELLAIPEIRQEIRDLLE